MRDLQSLREEIDQLDEQLWDIIAQRADVARAIGEWKHAHGGQVLQPARWPQVVEQGIKKLSYANYRRYSRTARAHRA